MEMAAIAAEVRVTRDATSSSVTGSLCCESVMETRFHSPSHFPASAAIGSIMVARWEWI